MIRRRNLLGAGLLGIGGAAASFGNPDKAADLAAPSISRNRRRLNMVTTWPKGLPGLGEAAERAVEPGGDSVSALPGRRPLCRSGEKPG